MSEEKSFQFYKDFYEDNKIKLLQYENLREHFGKLVDEVLGEDYYNMAMDVYECDRICCEDVAFKARGFFGNLFRRCK